jgi:hypothetical protein
MRKKNRKTGNKNKNGILYSDQIVGTISQPDLFCIFYLMIPVSLRMHPFKLVSPFMVMRGENGFGKPGLPGSPDRNLLHLSQPDPSTREYRCPGLSVCR